MMTHAELAKYLGIADAPNWQAVIDQMPPRKRAVYERMAALEIEIDLWQQGLGPKPKGVLIDASRTPAHAKGRVQRLKKRMMS